MRQLEAEMKTLMTQARAAAKVAQGELVPPSGSPRPTAVSTVMQNSIEITKLEAQLSKEYDAYQLRPKRTFIGAILPAGRPMSACGPWPPGVSYSRLPGSPPLARSSDP